MFRQYSIRTLLVLTVILAAGSLGYTYLRPQPRVFETAKKRTLEQDGAIPKGMAYWFLDGNDNIVSAFLIFGDHPIANFPHIDDGFYVEGFRIPVPRDRQVYIISPTLELVEIDLTTDDVIKDPPDYSKWGRGQTELILQNTWVAPCTSARSNQPFNMAGGPNHHIGK